MIYARLIHGTLLAAALLVCGCAKDDGKPQITGVSPGDAQSMNARNPVFEKTQDPPFTAQTHFAAGQLAESHGASEKAIEQYQKALKLDPKHLPSLYRIAMIQVQSREYDKAIESWRAYVRESGGSPNAQSNLGFCYELAGQPFAAEEVYRQGIARDSRNVPCRVNYGLMLARLGRTNEAIVQLQAVLPPAQVHYNLGSVYEQLGKRQQAKEEYRQAAQLDPNLVQAKSKLASID
jgi:tetratricopeptide (TPR) repeat protein